MVRSLLLHNKRVAVSDRSSAGPAVEAMNTMWSEKFGYDLISERTIKNLTLNDMYDD